MDSEREREDRIDVELKASGYPRPKKQSGREEGEEESLSEGSDEEEDLLEDEEAVEEKKAVDLNTDSQEEGKEKHPD